MEASGLASGRRIKKGIAILLIAGIAAVLCIYFIWLPGRLTRAFVAHKGQLMWPVEKGCVIHHFGIYTDTNYHIELNCNGIEIQTDSQAQARAVFEGAVSSVISIDDSKVVVVKHGDFYTVYNNLSSALVRKGNRVTKNQALGCVAPDYTGRHVLSFQVWEYDWRKKTVQLNPEDWLAKTR